MTNEEINKAIAEKVTGFRPKYEGEYPPYATNISVAWQVVKKIIETGAEFFLYYEKEKKCWTCEISSEEARSAFIEDGDTESMAICTAALRLFAALKAIS